MTNKTTQPESDLEVKLASPDELGLVIGILAEAGQWLLAKGIRQWPTPPPDAFMLAAINRGEVYIARIAETPCGTFTLSWSDSLWEGHAGQAGYVHRLAVRRSFGGRGLGLGLLREAQKLTARAGKQFLRLDCWAGNSVLCEYYDKAGFTRRGTAAEEDYLCCLFEKATT